MITPSNRADDLKLLERVLSHRESLREDEREAFEDMQSRLHSSHYPLSEKQRVWAEQVLERFEPKYENLVSSGKVPRGREVATPEVLKHLPKKPPPRPARD